MPDTTGGRLSFSSFSRGPPPPDPAKLQAINYAFKSSRATHVAAKLGLFTLLDDHNKGLTHAELVAALGLCKTATRGTADFLDILVAVGFLDREGTGESARYRNSAEASAFLVEGRNGYLGDAFVLSHDRTWHVFTDLLPALRAGETPPSPHVQRISAAIYDASASANAAAAEAFAAGMASINAAAFTALAESGFVPLRRAKTHADIGGGAAALSCALARAHRQLRCTSCDLPHLAQLARREIERKGLGDRVATAELDFLKDDFPAADVITMSMVLHNWRLETKKLLVCKAYAALPAGGVFLEINSIVDNDRRGPLGALELSLTQLVEFGRENAFVYTLQDFDGWAREAGFVRTELLPLSGVKAAAVAYK